MGPAVLIGGGVILALIIALSGKSEAAEAAPQPLPPIPPIPPGPVPPVPPDPIPDPAPDPKPEPAGPVMVTPSGPLLLTSPFKQIPTKSWSKFVQLLARGRENTITKGARYGMFLFGVRRLADLGLVTDIKRGQYKGQTVWTGTWVPPYSEAKFLSSSKTQYRALIKSMLEYAKKYKAARKQNSELFLIGTKPLTMSGFLAFAHLVGFMGAINSLKTRKIRPDTLAFINKANGLF